MSSGCRPLHAFSRLARLFCSMTMLLERRLRGTLIESGLSASGKSSADVHPKRPSSAGRMTTPFRQPSKMRMR